MSLLLEDSSPTHFEKEPSASLDSSPFLSASSEDGFWSTLRNRIDSLLMDRKRRRSPIKQPFPIQDLSQHDPTDGGDLECGKTFREDSFLLLRGLDSIAFSLSQLTKNLDTALQGSADLAKPTLSELFHRAAETTEHEETQPKAKRRCGMLPDFDHSGVLQIENKANNPEKFEKLEKARNLAVSMATKAASLAKELKSVKSDLCYMNERCALLEEENRRLRDGFSKGIRPDEDDLVRLQLEALLAEKSRLANENANLIRENQCLHQLVEYHQVTMQELSASIDHPIVGGGLCLDFSSPTMAKLNNYDDDDDRDCLSTRSSQDI